MDHHAPAPEDALCVRDLAVGYRDKRENRIVLEHVNVAARAGDLACLLGPNGAGKSTLLRTVAGMQRPLGGSVRLDGVDVHRLRPADRARRLGVVLTDRVIPEAISAREIVELGRFAHSGWLGLETRRDEAAVDGALDAVGAGGLAHRPFARLSDGERQRIMIARALAQEPAVLLLDEPTAFLDAPSRVEIVGLLLRLTRESSLAVVMSTHDVELALRTADVVWLATPGGSLLIGAPEDVVLAGGMGRAFGESRIRFCNKSLAFRPRVEARSRALVHGAGVRARMARSALERAGYEVEVHGRSQDSALAVQVDDGGWQAWSADGAWRAAGDDFASLAMQLRERGSHGRNG